MIYSAMLATLLVAVKSVSGAVAADKVNNLPGYATELPSAHYSGYIPVGNLTGVPGHLHYWFIESEGSPAEDPVVLWLNGGPGSSSLIGLLTENGQISTNDNSLLYPIDGVPQVFYNSYGWTRKANMLYLESPKGVGFSYCDDVTSEEECVNDDTSTALDAYEFLVNWFAAYPEYKSNKFYITGESYAGIYIPMIMEQVSIDSLGAQLNLIGGAIGNGCWGVKVGTCAHGVEQQQINAEFFFGHGMYSQVLYGEVQAACQGWTELTESCSAKLDEMYEQMGDYDVYNVYDECGADNRRRLTVRKPLREVFAAMAAEKVTVMTEDSFRISAGYSATMNDYECGGHTAMNAWLAEPSVVEALHVTANTPGMTYHKTAADLQPLYAQLINKYQMLIYSGDTDGCVPFVGSEYWTRQLNFTLVDDWHQWFAHPDEEHGLHKAGYAITYDKFQFVTVNGAGHMVPTFQPGYGFDLFGKFLANEKF